MLLTVREQSFKQEVLDSPIPVVVNFWAPWCGICRLITPLLTKLQAEWGDRVTIVSINADESLKLASTYRLTTLPTLLVFESGKLSHRIDSFHGREDLRTALEKLMASHVYSVK
jgi:thioredoxin 1